MTKTQFKKKMASMKKDINQYIDREITRLFDMNGIDVKNEMEGDTRTDPWDIDFDDDNIDWSEHAVNSWAKKLESSMLKDVN